MTKTGFSKGVSIIEILVVISIIGILSGITVAGFFYYKKGNSFELSAKQVANLVRRAQAKSVAVNGDSVWGVHVTSQQAIVFKGADFTNRDRSFDENVFLDGITSVSGSSQFVFQKFSGIPQTPGNLTVSNGSESKTINVNEKGIVSF